MHMYAFAYVTQNIQYEKKMSWKMKHITLVQTYAVKRNFVRLGAMEKNIRSNWSACLTLLIGCGGKAEYVGTVCVNTDYWQGPSVQHMSNLIGDKYL